MMHRMHANSLNHKWWP